MITTWPNGDQYVAVSTVVSPVTHTAETLVKAAVSTGGRLGPGVETGRESSTVPTTMAIRNATGTIRAGCVAAARTPPMLSPCPSSLRSLDHNNARRACFAFGEPEEPRRA